MTRNTALKILNPFLFILIINQAISGIFGIHYSHQAFGILHKNSGVLLICLIALHFTLNFNWVRANFFAR
jgi:hypothetical protein